MASASTLSFEFWHPINGEIMEFLEKNLPRNLVCDLKENWVQTTVKKGEKVYKVLIIFSTTFEISWGFFLIKLLDLIKSPP